MVDNYIADELSRRCYAFYWVQAEGVLDKMELPKVQKVADKYHAASWGFLGNEGVKFAFRTEPDARGFLGDIKGLAMRVSLLKESCEELQI